MTLHQQEWHIISDAPFLLETITESWDKSLKKYLTKQKKYIICD